MKDDSSLSTHPYHQGSPRMTEHQDALRGDPFLAMERYSNAFLRRHREALAEYSRKWVADPLHSWSRRWEYPFVFSELRAALASRAAAKVLDAGSGVTFLPYYVMHSLPGVDVYCSDLDGTLEGTFDRLNQVEASPARFIVDDLAALRFPDGEFDFIYSISVIEHAEDHVGIVDEFARTLKSGGGLAVTFDISLDGTREIPVDRAQCLVECLLEHFDPVAPITPVVAEWVAHPGLVTTRAVGKIDPASIPWRRPSLLSRLKHRIRHPLDGSWIPPLTFACLSLVKP